MRTITLTGRCSACGAGLSSDQDATGDVVLCPECGARNWRDQLATSGPSHNGRSRQGRPAARGGYIICPNMNCGYRGQPRVEQYGSILVAVLLLLFALLPGVLYILFGMGRRTSCPVCGFCISTGR